MIVIKRNFEISQNYLQEEMEYLDSDFGMKTLGTQSLF